MRQLRHPDGRFAGLRSYIRSLGTGGLALLVGLMVGHAIVWYPSEIVTSRGRIQPCVESPSARVDEPVLVK
jgi:hypothetical protein